MPKVRLTVTESHCRAGDVFIVEDLCPPICHELWNAMYPMVYALLNGAQLDCGEARSAAFDIKCSDGGRVCVHGERIEE